MWSSREDIEKTMSSSSRSLGSRTETEASWEKRPETRESSNGFSGSMLEVNRPETFATNTLNRSGSSASMLEVKRQETVVTNEKEVARLIKLVRPRWKRADLILQVNQPCFLWSTFCHNWKTFSRPNLTFSYNQRISPLVSNLCWVAYNINNPQEKLLIQTLPRFQVIIIMRSTRRSSCSQPWIVIIMFFLLQ